MNDEIAREMQASYERGIATGEVRERKRWEDAITKMTARPMAVTFQDGLSLVFGFVLRWRKEENELVGELSLLEEF